MTQIKEGDIVICKKELKYTPNKYQDEEKCKFLIGKKYVIGEFSKIWYDKYHIEISDILDVTYSYQFCIVIGSYHCVWDYFYSEKELRKKKLDQINGNK